MIAAERSTPSQAVSYCQIVMVLVAAAVETALVAVQTFRYHYC